MHPWLGKIYRHPLVFPLSFIPLITPSSLQNRRLQDERGLREAKAATKTVAARVEDQRREVTWKWWRRVQGHLSSVDSRRDRGESTRWWRLCGEKGSGHHSMVSVALPLKFVWF